MFKRLFNLFKKSVKPLTENELQLTICITKEFRLKCTVVDYQGKEKNIQFEYNREKEDIPITIEFDMNEIIIGKEMNEITDENVISYNSFWKDFIESPELYKEYKIHYRRKEYSIIAEMFLALIFYEFKNIIDKSYIIRNVIFDFPEIISSNSLIMERIITALIAIGFENFNYDESGEERLEYGRIREFYKEQGNLLHEIIEERKEFIMYKSLLQRAQSIPTTLSQDKINLLMIDNTKPFGEYEYYQLIRNFTFEERTQLQLTQLDNYCLFLTSKWFESIEDHINFTTTCKRLELNMTKFHFNPVSLNSNKRNKTILSKSENFV